MKLSQIFFMIEIGDEILTETFWLVFLQPSLTMIDNRDEFLTERFQQWFI